MPSQQEIIAALELLNPESKKKVNKILGQFSGLKHGKESKIDIDHLLDDVYPQEELEEKFKEFGSDLQKAGLSKDILEKILWLKQKKELIQQAKAEYIKKMIKGQKIRIFCDLDWDGAVAAAIVRLFSEADVQDVIAAGANFDINGKFTGGGKKEGILDIAVDTREKHGREDIRIDHHTYSSYKEDKDRLTFIINPHYRSTARLAADIFKAPVDSEILNEIDDLDRPGKRISAWATHFVNTGFMKEHGTLGPAAAAKALTAADFSNAKKFHESMMPFLQKGFNVASLGGKYEEHEKMLADKFNIRFIKTAKVIIAYSDDSFKLPSQEFGNAIYYFKPVYYTNEADLPAYHLYTFYPSKRSKEEPFELFVGRNDSKDVVDIKSIFEEAKSKFGDFNGGAGPDVGGANFPGAGDTPSEKAKLVYQFILKKITEHYGVLNEIKGIKWLKPSEAKKEGIVITSFEGDSYLGEGEGEYIISLKVEGTIDGDPFIIGQDKRTEIYVFNTEGFDNEEDFIDKIYNEGMLKSERLIASFNVELGGALEKIRNKDERNEMVKKILEILSKDPKWEDKFRAFFEKCNETASDLAEEGARF